MVGFDTSSIKMTFAPFVLQYLPASILLVHGCAVIAIGCDQKKALKKLLSKKFDCDKLTGHLVFSDELKKIFKRVKVIQGNLSFRKRKERDLRDLENLKISSPKGPALIIEDNINLTDIRALLTITFEGTPPYVTFKKNPKLCDVMYIKEKLWEKVEGGIPFNDYCLSKCKGSLVNDGYLKRLPKHCAHIEGDLKIVGRNGVSKELLKLKQVETVDGVMIIANNSGIHNLDFLSYVRKVGNKKGKGPALLISNNTGLQELSLTNLEEIVGSEQMKSSFVIEHQDGEKIADLEALQEFTSGHIPVHIYSVETSEEKGEDDSLTGWLLVIGFSLLSVLGSIITVVVVIRRSRRACKAQEQAKSAAKAHRAKKHLKEKVNKKRTEGGKHSTKRRHHKARSNLQKDSHAKEKKYSKKSRKMKLEPTQQSE